MRKIAGFLLLGVLFACGVDGPPIPPDDREPPKPGITISGSAQVGVAGGSDGATRMINRLSD